MAKKHKKNIQELLKKKQLLQNVNQAVNSMELTKPVTTTTPISTKTNSAPPAITSVQAEITTTASQTGREIRWTVISLILILTLLGGVIILDQKTPFLSEFGNWLYLKLQLKS